MHENDTPPDDGFWNFVATYIDEADLERLRVEWNDSAPERFAKVAIHVSSCIPCLERRLVKLKEWRASDSATTEEES